MTTELSVIAPCFNEEGNLRRLVSRLQAAFLTQHIAGEIVLVNDGSKDGTGALADLLANEHPNIFAVHHPTNRGIVAGWRSGLAACHGDMVCLIDADLQNLPEDVPRLYNEIRNTGADVIQGTRIPPGRPDSRYLFSRGLNVILNWCFGMRLRDNKSGFVLCRREVMAEILQHRLKYYYFQSLIMVSAASKGYRIGEIDTVFERRFAGRSFIPAFPVLFISKVLVDILKAIYEYRLSAQPATRMGESL